MAGAAKVIKRADASFTDPVRFDANNTAVSAAGAAATLTIAADTNRPIGLSEIWVGYDTDPTGGAISIESPANTTVWGPFPIPAKGTYQFTFHPPLCGAKNTAMVVKAAAGGGTVVATVAATPLVFGPELPG